MTLLYYKLYMHIVRLRLFLFGNINSTQKVEKNIYHQIWIFCRETKHRVPGTHLSVFPYIFCVLHLNYRQLISGGQVTENCEFILAFLTVTCGKCNEYKMLQLNLSSTHLAVHIHVSNGYIGYPSI